MIFLSRHSFVQNVSVCATEFARPNPKKHLGQSRAPKTLVPTSPAPWGAHAAIARRGACQASGSTRQELLLARFKSPKQEQQLMQAYQLCETIGRSVVGQDLLAKSLQARVVQFLEGWGTQRKAPLALHLIGLPGMGKSAALAALEGLGIDIVRIDAQEFYGETESGNGSYRLLQMLDAHKTSEPRILLFDELDKVAEIDGSEIKTSPKQTLMTSLNQLVDTGLYKTPDGTLRDFSDCLILTSMNLSPRDVEAFAPQVLGQKKSYYDFTVEDMARFDMWLRDQPACSAKVLAHMFRPSTVSRLEPNTFIVKPLTGADYRAIIARQIVETLASCSHEDAKKVAITYDESFVDFLADRVVYAPAGARPCVMKTRLLTEQLFNIAVRAQGLLDASLVQPRTARIHADPAADAVTMHVEATAWRDGKTGVTDAFDLNVPYNRAIGVFETPANVALAPPQPRTVIAADRPPTGREIRSARFPASKDLTRGLASRINQTLVGQEPFVALVESDLNAYLGRAQAVRKNPPFRIFAGFPGIGKSALVELAAEHAQLPIARINLQAYTGSDGETINKLFADLEQAQEQARAKGKHGKYIVLLEEMDKVFEINPQTHLLMDRPAMNYIKDLLNDGLIRATQTDVFGARRSRSIDIRDSYCMVTMNLGMERFAFKADPRRTTIDDVTEAWESLQTRSDLRAMLESMFLPETVNRLMPRFAVMRPLQRAHYETLIDHQTKQVAASRLRDPDTGRNTALIDLQLTPAYRAFLYDECVIPSEGARNTVIASQQRVLGHLEEAMTALEKGGKQGTQPLVLTLDYDSATQSVGASVKLSSATHNAMARSLYTRRESLFFPPMVVAVGALSEERLLTAVHEMGHLMAGVRLGKRFSFATVVPPEASVGGYVRFEPSDGSARDSVSGIYVALGSRAMERIFLSDAPTEPQSVLSITSGASSDIKKATKALWHALYTCGFDPFGGAIERSGLERNPLDELEPYAAFEALPDATVQKLQVILHKMEAYVVADLLGAHPKLWYRQRIAEFARLGGINEHKAYAMLGYPHPGEDKGSLASNSHLREAFDDLLEPLPETARVAAAFAQGQRGTTARENAERAMAFFAKTVKEELHCQPESGPKKSS